MRLRRLGRDVQRRRGKHDLGSVARRNRVPRAGTAYFRSSITPEFPGEYAAACEEIAAAG